MSIFIRGVDLPENCMDCPVDFPICDLWTHSAFEGIKGNPYYIRHPNCPIIEVPAQHGRLIDADALIADMKRQCREVFRVDAVSPDDFWITRNEAYNERLWRTWCESFYDYLDARPTILEAEDGDKLC